MITIAIPCYNSEKYIAGCINSVLKQTFKDIEILIINDVCTDKSIDIVNRIIKNNNTPIRIRIISQEKNSGVGCARNRAIDEALGDYIFFLDSDDSISRDCISILYNKINGTKCNYIIGSHYCYSDQDDKILENEIYEDAYIKNNFELYKYRYGTLKHSLFSIFVWNILFNIEFLRSNNLRFLNVRKDEDHIFFLSMMPFTSSCIITSDITYKYVKRKGSLCNYFSNDSIPIETINISIQNYLLQIELLKERSSNYYFPEIIAQWIKEGLWMVFAIYRNRKRIEPKFTYNTIESLLFSPLSFTEIIKLKRKRLFILSHYFLCNMPHVFQKIIISMMSKK